MQKIHREHDNSHIMLDEEVVSATSGCGAVELTVNGYKEVLKAKDSTEENESSIIVRVTVNEKKILFTGDIGSFIFFCRIFCF